ncbi:N-6 DNA methylase [Aggregatibacter actinomycetemcomitans]|uniref:N-6 DNA methylase n=2 Tax=Aggregatibacter actinomycetemcomitans TaxID=714 RepID=UPI001E421FB5
MFLFTHFTKDKFYAEARSHQDYVENSATQQAFLNDLDEKLWSSADRLRQQLDAANYKHIVLGLIFLKYISDSFTAQQDKIRVELSNPENPLYLDRTFYNSDEEYQEALDFELENRNYYTADNVFWVPASARWQALQEVSILNTGAELPWGGKFVGVARLIDDAFDAIEKDNEKLKGVLQCISGYAVNEDTLRGLIMLFSDTNFTAPSYNGEPVHLGAKDILGHVYEYFLGRFAQAEGKRGGQYFTPKSIVSLIVEMLEPYKGRVYDPAMGSGGFFVQTERFITAHQGKINQASIYGQEFNPTTWKLAAMNMAIRGIDYDFGKHNADSFAQPQHLDKKMDFIMAKPAMVMSDSRYEHLVISLDVGVVRPFDEVYKYFLYCLAMTDSFQAHTKSFCTGTTVLHLGKDAVPSFEFVNPNDELLKIFCKQASPIFEKINLNIEENKSLEKTRDLLLPRLLNGDLQNINEI